MRVPRSFLPAVLLASIASGAFGQARFGADATVISVEVPVNVVRDGAPVRGLTIDDFEILEGRKRQPITGFEVVDLSLVGVERTARGPEIPTLTIGGRRHFLLLFDMSFSDLEALDRARTAAREIIASSLHPSDLVGVATYNKVRGTRLILGFTGNREQAEAAIRNLGLRDWRERVPDPLGLVIAGDADLTSTPTEEGGASETRSERELLEGANSFDLQIGFDRARLDQQKSDFLSVTETFAGLAGMVADVDGRKHVVLLSEGFESEVLTGVDDAQRQIEINQAAELGQTWAINSNERFGDSDASSSLNAMVEAFRRADCTMQAVSIAGLDAGAKISRNEAMFRMANETGGELIQNFNNVGAAMGEVLERTSVTYLLAFEPADVKADGKFRPIKVRLKNAPRGTRLLHRSGYFPPKEFGAMSPLERQLTTASTVLGGSDGGRILTSVLAAPFHVQEGLSYVPVLIELDGASLLGTARGDTLITEIFAYAFDESGAVRDFFTRRLGLDAKASRDALLQSGFKYWGHLDLEPGDYVLRVMTRNGQTGESGVASVPLSVPDVAAGQAVLLPPLFPEPMGKWVLGREAEDEQRAGVDFPFMLEDQPFIPAAQPKLAAGPSQVSLVGYNLGEGELSVSAVLLDHNGARVLEPRLDLVGRSHGADGLQRLVVEFEAGPLQQGSYTLVTTVRDLVSGGEQKSTAQVTAGS